MWEYSCAGGWFYGLNFVCNDCYDGKIYLWLVS